MTRAVALAALAALAGLALACTGDDPDGGRRCSLGLALDQAGCDELLAMVRPDEPPPSPTNAYADDLAAATLGHQLFFDARFSSNNDVRCATCHQPERAFGDRSATATGLGSVPRNSPTTLDAGWLRWPFWDGRADSVWSQPLFALEAETEMGTTRLAIAHRISRSYATLYEPVFGALPPLADELRFPANGKPGDAAWEAMTDEDRDAIDRVFANVGKALEAYQRRLVTGPSAFDRFLAGEPTLDADEQLGAAVFVRARCTSCHRGPALSDARFHNLGLSGDAGDPRGRARGIEILLANEFSASGPYADGPPPADFPPVVAPGDLGAFATPSLRNVALTAPYGHDGRWATLEAAIDAHLAGGGTPDVGVVDPLLVPVELDAEERAALVAFLGALSGAPPPIPWRNWPNG